MTTLELAAPDQWTVEYLERLPDDFRYEVHEGNLVVMAAAMPPRHADVQYRVMHLLRQQGRAMPFCFSTGWHTPKSEALYVETRRVALSTLEDELG